MEGTGSSLAYSAYIPLLTLNFPENRDKAISARACGSQLGKSFGFMIGGLAFTWLGYCG